MKRIVFSIVPALIVILAAFTATAATTFTAHAPEKVTVGNAFNVVFVLENGSGSGFQTPTVSGLKLLFGPAISQGYSVVFNGRTTSRTTEEYTMTYMAKSPGTYHIGAASITVDGRRMTTRPLTVKAVGQGQSTAPSSQAVPQGAPSGMPSLSNPMTQSAGKDVKGSDIFVRITMSKPQVYEQEAVVCTIKLYTKYQVSSFMATKQPSFNGFLIEELPLSPTINKVERIDGQNYLVAELKKCILYPQQSGQLSITSGNYDVTVVQFDTFHTQWGSVSQPVEKKLQVKSNQASVKIDPLPQPRPANFSGAVGDFTITSSVTPQSLKTYAPATYSLVVSGTGNLKYIKGPDVKFPSQFDTYDPQSKISVSPNGSNVSGTVKFDYMFIPQFVGNFDIPGFDFTYFNTKTRSYQTLHVPGHKLAVAKGSGKPSSHYKLQNADIHKPFPASELNLSRSHSHYVTSAVYWMCFVVPMVAFVVLLLLYRKMLREHSDVSLMRTRRASKVAQRRLKAARRFMEKDDRNGFYAELLNAVWGYLSDKIGIPVSELSKDNIQAELLRYGVQPDLCSRVLDLLDKCEFAQYAPELASRDMQPVLQEAAEIMDSLESTKPAKQ